MHPKLARQEPDPFPSQVQLRVHFQHQPSYRDQVAVVEPEDERDVAGQDAAPKQDWDSLEVVVQDISAEEQNEQS